MITRENYKNIARDLKISYSILKYLAKIRPLILLPDDISEVAFYDIETEGNNFKVGVVNDKVFYDAKEMLDYISKFKVCCGFNNFRFDNVILYKISSEHFKLVDYGNFTLYKIKNCINVDALGAFNLWRPFRNSHKLSDLAKELNLNIEFPESFDENKAKVDVIVLREFYPYLKDLLNWLEKNFFIDPETVTSLYYNSYSKLRRWILQSFALQRGIYPKPVRVEDERKASYFRFFREGFFKDIYVYDVSSAYPTTAIKLNCSIWKEGDFAEFEKFLLEERAKNPKIEQFIKYVANAIIGDMNCYDGILYNKKIMVDVWNTFKKVMEDWVNKIGLENIVYGYTDSVFVKKPINVFPEGYKVKLKVRFDWVVIYNQIRYVGKVYNENKIHKVHFDRKLNIKLFDYLDELIDKWLLENPKKFVKNPLKYKKFIDLKKFPKDAFKIVIFKKDNVCRNIEYLDIFDELDYGLNNVYLSRNGLTKDENKICYKKYEKYVNYYLKLFKLKNVEKTKKTGKNSRKRK